MNELDRANKAKAVLESPAFTDAFAEVRLGILATIEKTPLSEKDTINDLLRMLKLLNLVRSQLVTHINSGKLAEFRVAQEEKRKNPLFKYFR